jgi:hypothetical protein
MAGCAAVEPGPEAVMAKHMAALKTLDREFPVSHYVIDGTKREAMGLRSIWKKEENVPDAILQSLEADGAIHGCPDGSQEVGLRREDLVYTIQKTWIPTRII